VSDMLALYTSIADGSITKPKVTVVYDTFYHATESMARAVEEGVRSVGCDVERLNASVAGTTSVARHCFDSKVTAWGTPTLNGGMHPDIAGVLHYAKGLKLLEKKPGAVFGSYGWGPGGTSTLAAQLEESGSTLVCDPVSMQWRPTEEKLKECFDLGKRLGNIALEKEKFEIK
ncbi:Rubredoxin-oxygen oxidoreductase like protein, partial [Aduncisulcus paluster]